MNILLMGLSHKTAPVEIREKLAFTPATLRSALTHFDATHSQAHLAEVHEGVILSTCNRLEIYAGVGQVDVAARAIVNFLSQSSGLAEGLISKYLYLCQNKEAVSHLFRVAAGLDSMILGEPQILGQITQAYEAALAQGTAGTVLSALFRAAIHTGKRVRTETAIGMNPASVSSVAANLAGQLLGDLSSKRVLLIGAGEMGAMAARALLKRGVSNIVVTNRTYEHALPLAQTWGGRAVSFQQLAVALEEADIVLTSTGAPHTILNPTLLATVLAARPERPLLILDIAVPRDVDPDVVQIPNVRLYDIDDLLGQAEHNLRERQAEVPLVQAIIEAELAQFLNWFSSLDAVATIAALRQRAEQWREIELSRLFNRMVLNEREQELVAMMSHRLVNKILHEPTLCLKKETANGNGAAYISAMRQLFALDASG
ncbi:MAG: glutamyl-tRNA reductase [Anaerolineae bacterium]|nr:glutamyl-tRNA reductase [Anaerolineales bacterium]MCQ3980070.1 glutamyl-tRNA reductase [Anaerolineae bacterium]